MQTALREDTSTGDDPDSVAEEITLAMHTDRVVQSVEVIQNALNELAIPPVIWERLHTAAQYHDWGKTHEAFQRMLRGGTIEDLPAELLAKSQPNSTTNGEKIRGGSSKCFVIDPKNPSQLLERQYFRHELASALAFLRYRDFADDAETNLVAYLIAAHHGKVRASLRSLPDESRPPNEKTRFARGVWHGDELPTATLCDGVHVEPITLDLRVMSLGGESEDGQHLRSWSARVSDLRDATDLGPFRLAFLETLLRVADWRGSRKETDDV